MASAPVERPPTARRREPLVRTALRRRGVRAALWCVAILLVLGMLAIRVYLAEVGSLPGDEQIATRWPHPSTPQPFYELAEFYATIASPLVGLATVLLAAGIVWWRAGVASGLGVLLVALAIPANAALKTVFGPTQLYATLVP